MRLSLNVASTRVVLLEGHTGPGAAGAVIEAFGHFLIGGNFAVGLIVFSILVVINFVVVTKGAERIAEVSHVLPWTPCQANKWQWTPT
jgi:flagellar biosynthesis protein FlhA